MTIAAYATKFEEEEMLDCPRRDSMVTSSVHATHFESWCWFLCRDSQITQIKLMAVSCLCSFVHGDVDYACVAIIPSDKEWIK